ncbi:MAG: 3-hydroxyacyl-CoA dehydrogenase family protein [Acetobacteraceae bacterium]|nr:3-hydroxyacyl-CoA dehydrogenase family protein [Acetobacteraceae bacterium]
MSDLLPVVGVVGAGIMGAQIAQVIATAGCAVRLYDRDPAQLPRAMDTIEHGRFGLRRAVDRGKLAPGEVAAILARLHPAATLAEAVGDAGLVVEAVPEDLDLKCRVFRELDERAPPRAILTSNSAGLPITALAHATRRPGQVIGWHWAQPCAVMRMAELVRAPSTTDEAVAVVSDLARRCGKNPVVVKDQPEVWGYVANRINAAVRRESRRVVDEGICTEAEVDQLMKDCFRWPMGPFELWGGTTLK